MSSLVPILILTAIVIAFGAIMLFLTSKLGPKKAASAVKMMPYECGIRGEEKKDTKVSVRFYLTAILFILFDIEIIFMYPWALIYKDFLEINAIFIFSEMMIFIGVLTFGLFYVWKSGALEWE